MTIKSGSILYFDTTGMLIVYRHSYIDTGIFIAKKMSVEALETRSVTP